MKKKHFIGLSTLLLVLLLGLFTTSYAYNYTVTNSDIDLIVDYYFSGRSSSTTAKNNLYWALGRIYNDLGMNFITINVETSSYGQILIRGFDSSFISSVEYLNNENYMKVNFNTSTQVFTSTINMYNGQRSSSLTNYTSLNFGSGSQFRTVYLMYSNDILNNIGPWQNVEILQFSPPNYFTFIQNLNLDYSGDIALVSSQDDYLGVVSLGKNLNRIQTDYQYYDRYTKQWKIYHSEDLNLSGITDDDFYYYIRYAFNHREQYYLPNTLVQVYFVPKDTEEEFTTYFQPFYIVDRNTRYNTSGGIDLDDTFDDDSYWNYYIGNIDNLIDKQNNDKTTEDIINNDNDNTDKIIDTLTDDSQVDNILGEFVSGDASDIAEKFGFSIFNRYYYDFIHDTIVDIVEVLEDDGDVYFDYSMHGEAPTRIYASDFTTPDGPLKTFLSMFLISCTVFAFYKYIADLIELISTGNILEALQEFKVDRNIFKM